MATGDANPISIFNDMPELNFYSDGSKLKMFELAAPLYAEYTVLRVYAICCHVARNVSTGVGNVTSSGLTITGTAKNNRYASELVRLERLNTEVQEELSL